MSRSHTLPARIEAHLQAKLAALFAPARAAAAGQADALHRMRVATRRLRVGLQYFAALFPADELRQVQRQLRRATRTLGEIRSHDVNLKLLRRAQPPAVRRQLVRELRAARRQHLAELRELVQTFTTSRFAARIQALLANPRPIAGPRLLAEANTALGKLRREARRRLRKCQANDRALHKFRIAMKRYRYALETSEAVFRVSTAGRLRAVKAFQDCLGTGHDLEVLLEFLADCRRCWAKAKNTLVDPLDDMVTVFRHDQQQARDELRNLLRAERGWLKKVKLHLPYD